jgi:hypothetical protein
MMLFKLLDYLGFHDNSVQLGVSAQMSKDKRHGVVHYDTQQGIAHIGFLADKPHRLSAHDRTMNDRLFRQLDRMSMPATTLEVKRGRSAFLIKRLSGSLAAARLRLR